MVRFGDVVQQMSESERNPVEAGLNRVVGLEHIDTDDLHIKRWDDISDGTSFSKRFRKGQVLFGRRRAYLRKVAYAEFNGICSGDITVLQPKDGGLLPELLPFLLQTDGFLAYVLSVSAGGLSPRARWRDLAKYEFPLPPKPEQRRIAEILWAAEKTIELRSCCLSRLDALRAALMASPIGPSRSASVNDLQPLDDFIQLIQYGSSKRGCRRAPGLMPMLRIPNVVEGRPNLDDLQWVPMDDAERSLYELTLGDILIVRTNGNPDYVGRTVAVDDECVGMVFASYLIRIRVDSDRLNPSFLNALFQTSATRRRLRGEIRSSAGNYNLNTKGIRRLMIPVPPKREQDRLMDTIQRMDSTKVAMANGQNGRSIGRFLTNHLLSPAS